MFRFFPTVLEEFAAINMAMKMRDIRIGGKNAGKFIEYRLVPLMVCSVNIGSELSGGQKQRVAIASALLAGKKLLVFDEPTSGLDFRSMEVTAELLCLLRNDCTVLIVTHDMELIERCCTHILHIENGQFSQSSL